MVFGLRRSGRPPASPLPPASNGASGVANGDIPGSSDSSPSPTGGSSSSLVKEASAKAETPPHVATAPAVATVLSETSAGRRGGADRSPSPELSADWVTRVLQLWVLPLIVRGWKAPLTDADLYELNPGERAAVTSAALADAWAASAPSSSASSGDDAPGAAGAGATATASVDRDARALRGRLATALFRVHRRIFFATGVLKAIDTSLGLMQPIILNLLLRFLARRTADPSESAGEGIGLSVAFLAILAGKTIVENVYFLNVFRMAIRVRSGLQSNLYRKALTISPAARSGTTVGEIVNYMQLDAQRIGDLAQFVHATWSSPVAVIVSVGLLYHYIGPSAFIGVGVTLVMLPVQGKLIGLQSGFRKSVVGITDTRVKLMSEILQGIKAVKFYAWERPFISSVVDVRSREVTGLRKLVLVSSGSFALILFVPVFTSIITFAFYRGVFGNALLAADVFTAVALLNALRSPIIVMPAVVTALIDARVGIKRLQSFFGLEETSNYHRGGVAGDHATGEEAAATGASGGDAAVRGLVEVIDGTFSWGAPTAVLAAADAAAEGAGPDGTSAGSSMKADPASAAAPTTATATTAALDTTVAVPSDDAPAGSPATPPADAPAETVPPTTSVVLRNVTVRCEPGKLTAIIGRVGAGKSSLLQAMLGELTKLSGSVRMVGSCAYVAQTAWILNGTLRENILFGTPYDEARYKAAVHAAVLADDLAVLPAGDATAIGEKGINLSGGQKQRVALARAIYADADVFLLDDPLSALDAHVGAEVFRRCMGPGGVLHNRTTVLVTNQLHVLPEANLVVFLQAGRVKNVGGYKELMRGDADFRKLMEETTGATEAAGRSTGSAGRSRSVAASAGGAVTASAAAAEVAASRGGGSRSISRAATGTASRGGRPSVHSGSVTGGTADGADDNDAAEGSTLMVAEERQTGNVLGSVYLQYSRAAGGVVVFTLALIFFLLSTAVPILTTWWLSFWTEQEAPGEMPRSLGFYLGIYFALGIAYPLVTFACSAWFYLSTLRASRKMHNAALASVMLAPLSYFDTTPLGRILARFSKDTDGVDSLLPTSIYTAMLTCGNLLAAVVQISIFFPVFLAVAAPVSACYVALQRFFNRTSLELKRLDAISRSPIFAHFSESLGGLGTIRAFGRRSAFEASSLRMVDQNTRAYWLWVAGNRWFSLSLEVLGALLVFSIAIFAVTFANQLPSAVGLSLTSALQVTAILGFTVRSVTEVESNFASVERLLYYADSIPQEAAYAPPGSLSSGDNDVSGSGGTTKRTAGDAALAARLERSRAAAPAGPPAVAPPPGWPSSGAVEFRNVSLRYRAGLDLVLRGVNLSVPGGSRVGVVGRTGAGKSSLMIALLRLVEVAGGDILVDGVNLASLGLEAVRGGVCIIPQDPVMFSGSLRFNVDPFEEHSDAEIWAALEAAHLKQFVTDFEGGLHARIAEYGENLSAGQRQLVCLARALLRRPRLLLLDEASSSLDVESDTLLQATLRRAFRDCTVLTIAHRLSTIADYDSIVVMDAGKVADHDSPEALLERPGSLLYQLVEAMGTRGAAAFRELVRLGRAGRAAGDPGASLDTFLELQQRLAAEAEEEADATATATAAADAATAGVAAGDAPTDGADPAGEES